MTPVTEDARRQKEQRLEEREHRLEGDADDAERNRNQPDDGRQKECQQRNGPAQDKEDAPSDKENERFHLVDGDLTDSASIDNLVKRIKPNYFINFGANSCADTPRSITMVPSGTGALLLE